MKWWGWPRPPFILAFILGPVVERNVWPALQIGEGPLIFLTRPFALSILLLGTAFIVFITWALRDRSISVLPIAQNEPAPLDVPSAMSLGPLHFSRRTLDRRWRWEYLLWLVMIGWVGGVVFPATLGYSGPTRFLPFWGSIAFFFVMGMFVVTTILPKAVHGTGKIMDIGMRSGSDNVAMRKLFPLIAWVVGFVILAGITGFPLATVIFPVVFIPFNTDLRGRRLSYVLIPGLLAAFVSYGIMDSLLHVLWPHPFIRDWFLG